MLVKTKQNSKGEQIYVNKFTGVEGTLGQHTFRPSIRQSMRETIRAPRVVTNRKSTKGRRIYLQSITKNVEVFDRFEKLRDKRGMLTGKVKRLTTFKDKVVKTIKHIQETPNAIQRKTALFNFNEKLLVLKSKWHKDHPEYQKKAI